MYLVFRTVVKYRKIPPAAAANQIAENARIPPTSFRIRAVLEFAQYYRIRAVQRAEVIFLKRKTEKTLLM
jgi:hypothetical protein